MKANNRVKVSIQEYQNEEQQYDYQEKIECYDRHMLSWEDEMELGYYEDFRYWTLS